MLQSEFSIAPRPRRVVTIIESRNACDEVVLEKYVCVADVVKGNASIIGTGNVLSGSLITMPFGRGTMKLAYDVSVLFCQHSVS